MAYRRFRRYRKGGNASATKGLTQLLALGLGLWGLDKIFTAILPTLQTSTYFADVISLMITLIPVFGIMGAYFIIRNMVKQMNF